MEALVWSPHLQSGKLSCSYPLMRPPVPQRPAFAISGAKHTQTHTCICTHMYTYIRSHIRTHPLPSLERLVLLIHIHIMYTCLGLTTWVWIIFKFAVIVSCISLSRDRPHVRFSFMLTCQIGVFIM